MDGGFSLLNSFRMIDVYQIALTQSFNKYLVGEVLSTKKDKRSLGNSPYL